jgi:restriction system protein
VNEILKAQGYRTELAQPGPDEGIDIIAGQGKMGFDSPRLVVQVKSEQGQIGVGELDKLRGLLQKFGADQGLYVSWGGFKANVDKESRKIFFQIRIWDSDDLLSALFENYEKLSEDIQAEIPLKKIWTLVLPEE